VGWFFDTDLRNGHEGLAKVASKEKYDVENLKCGQLVLFLNRKLNAMKIYTAAYGVLHHKNKEGRPYNFYALQLVPQFMNGASIGYDQALKAAVVKHFAKAYPDLSRRLSEERA